ncbi:hypothetical protein GCM10010331_68940 [Streptomyces xanthochromogenes]|nr:hypothetical protein GCM10010331_68940 [Streptomyces xanthochromogenes]
MELRHGAPDWAEPIDQTKCYTTTLKLTWLGSGQEWRLESFSEEPGPTPSPGQAPPLQPAG